MSPLANTLRLQRLHMAAAYSLAKLTLNEIRWQKTRRRIEARNTFDYPRLDWMVIALRLTPEMAKNVSHTHGVQIVVDEAA